MRVMRTDDRGNLILRRRKCDQCGHRFVSQEAEVGAVVDAHSRSVLELDLAVLELLESLRLNTDSDLRRLVATHRIMTSPSKGETNGDR